MKKTLIETMGYDKVIDGVWRFFDLKDIDKSGMPVAVGPTYPTESLLIADMRRYLHLYGYTDIEVTPSLTTIITELEDIATYGRPLATQQPLTVEESAFLQREILPWLRGFVR